MPVKSGQEGNPPVQLPNVEDVAQAIVDIDAAIKRMNSSRLKYDAIVTLLKAQCGSRVGVTQIRLVLQELGRMDRTWLKPLEVKPKQ